MKGRNRACYTQNDFSVEGSRNATLSCFQAPRAKIFRRDEGDAASLAALQSLMRSNNWDRDSVHFLPQDPDPDPADYDSDPTPAEPDPDADPDLPDLDSDADPDPPDSDPDLDPDLTLTPDPPDPDADPEFLAI